MTEILTTARLALREMDHGDLAFLAEMQADPEVMRFFPESIVREGAEARLQRQLERYRKYGHGLWLVLDRASGQPVGQCGLTLQDVDGRLEPEVGYLVHRPFWRRGYATEAARGVRDWAFSRGIPRVISLIRPENVPSQGVALKLGMAVEGETTFAGLRHLVFAVARPKS